MTEKNCFMVAFFKKIRYKSFSYNICRDCFGKTEQIESRKYGKMAEWSNAADSKSVIGLVSIWGSNPHLPATINLTPCLPRLFYCLKYGILLGHRGWPQTLATNTSVTHGFYGHFLTLFGY